jgi:alkaline phosphatase
MIKRRGLPLLAILVAVSFVACSQATFVRPADTTLAAVDKQVAARSLILFIGDGMGPEMLSLAKIYSDKVLGTNLNLAALSATGTMGLVTTYSANRLVTDSAAGATAIATGVKTNNGMVGQSPDGEVLVNLLEMAYAAGKSVGVVTTTNVTDATPAAFLAHEAARAKETDIADQIVGTNATVVMGGGRVYFTADGGKRTDGRDLVADAREKGFDVAFDRDDLAASAGRRLLGLFADEDMPFEGDRIAYETPSLSEMFRKALRMLTDDTDGFVLVVEGGRIDHAEHENNLAAAMGELLAFDAAIGEAMEYQRSDSTLAIIVTADHDTGAPALTDTEKGYPPVESAGSLLDKDYGFLVWLSRNHAGTMVPIIARGPGDEIFAGIRDNTDTNRGMVRLLGLEIPRGR